MSKTVARKPEPPIPPKCEGCSCRCGEGYEENLSPYRGHSLCGHCIANWKTQERIADRKETTWEEFLSPQLRYFRKYLTED